MPSYDYKCPVCSHKEEVWKVMSALSRPELCPKCKTINMDLEVAAPAFHLKGTGWYVTDYKNKKAGKDGKNKDT